MDTQPEGAECAGCVHRVAWECRRIPPVVTRHTHIHPDAGYRDAEWGFAPAGLRCGEFKQADEAGRRA